MGRFQVSENAKEVRVIRSIAFAGIGLFLFSACGYGQEQGITGNAAGEALFKQRCAMCHEGGVPKAPNRAALKQMSPENVRFALVKGVMGLQGLGLSSAQIDSIAQYLTGKLPGKEQIPPRSVLSRRWRRVHRSAHKAALERLGH
jgi:polyvinyl alcohol dehydrogenase (cytochrome)